MSATKPTRTETDTSRPIVIIPVHKTNPDPLEIVSIRNCGTVLERRHICFLAPERLNLKNYHALIPAAEQIQIPNHWMESIQAYNRMMISSYFFQLVNDFTHVLIHEPDAIVLRDELDH